MPRLTATKASRNRLWRAGFMLGAVLLLVIMWRTFERHQVYFPSGLFMTTGAELGRPFEDVQFEAADGVRLHAWFYPGSTNSPRGNLVVLFCHGNAGNISHRLDTAEALLQSGVGVLLFDYRGYGRSTGTPSEEGTYLDGQAAYRWLGSKGYPGGRIIAYGESLGGGVAAELATRERVAGLVLQSTFTSIPDIGAELFPWLPVRWLSSIKYDTRSKLPRIRVPVLVLHSRTDELVRFHHAQDNYATANQPKLLCELTGGHNDGLGDREKFISDMKRFLEIVVQSNPEVSR